MYPSYLVPLGILQRYTVVHANDFNSLYGLSDVTDPFLHPDPEPEETHVTDPELRKKILSGLHTAHGRFGPRKSDRIDGAWAKAGKLRRGNHLHSLNPNAQRPGKIPKGYVRPPPGIRKLTDEEWEERKRKLKEEEEEMTSLDDETLDYEFGDESWDDRNNQTSAEDDEADTEDFLLEHTKSDFDKMFEDMQKIEYWMGNDRVLQQGNANDCTGDELASGDGQSLWTSRCEKTNFETSPYYERQYYDCAGRPLGGANGTWYKPLVPFEGKENTLYHAPAHAAETLGESIAYCRGLSSGFGNEITNFCPASLDENIYTWWHHPMQTFSGIGLNGGIWMGYMRNASSDTFYCSTLLPGGDSIEESYALYELGAYTEWAAFNPRTNTDYHYTYIRRTSPNWANTKMASFTTNNMHTVCEMNCEYYEGEIYVPDEDTACEARQKGQFPCEDDCFEGQCLCYDPDYAPHPNGSCIYSVQVYEIPCGDSGAVDRILEETLDHNDTEQLQVHGCHCIKMGETTQQLVQYIGGPQVLDELDELCKRYFDARKCIYLPGGNCYGSIHDGDAEYELVVNYTTGTFSCDLVLDPCLKDVCLIDVEYAAKILAIFEAIQSGDFAAIVGDETVCPRCKKGTGCRSPTYCEGEAPFVHLRRGVL